MRTAIRSAPPRSSSGWSLRPWSMRQRRAAPFAQTVSGNVALMAIAGAAGRLRHRHRRRLHQRTRRVRRSAAVDALDPGDGDFHGDRLRHRVRDAPCDRGLTMRNAVNFVAGLIFGLGLSDLRHGEPGQGAELPRPGRQLRPEPDLRDGRRGRGDARRATGSSCAGRGPSSPSGSTFRPRRTSMPGWWPAPPCSASAGACRDFVRDPP